jgi:hypothetical protein
MDVDASKPVTAFSVGAEGGRITLRASGPPDRRVYQLVVSDGTAAFLDEEDRPASSSRATASADDWEAALALLDEKYPRWARLHPLTVHPEFVERLRVAVEARCDRRSLENWRELLSP